MLRTARSRAAAGQPHWLWPDEGVFEYAAGGQDMSGGKM